MTTTIRDLILRAETAPSERERFNANCALMGDLATLLEALPELIRPGGPRDYVQALADHYAPKFHWIACDPGFVGDARQVDEIGELVPDSAPPPWHGAIEEARRQGTRLPILPADDEEAAGDLEDLEQRRMETILAYLERKMSESPDPVGRTDEEIAKILGVKRPMGRPRKKSQT